LLSYASCKKNYTTNRFLKAIQKMLTVIFSNFGCSCMLT